MEPIIEIKNLSKTFGSGDNQVAALQNVSLQIQSGEITEDLARANLITVTCVVHDTINLVFAKALESYNAEYEPDLTSGELMDLLKNPSMTDPRFMNLVAIALDVFNGNPNEGIPPYLESEEFSYSLDNAMAMVDAVMAAIKAINPNAAIVITNQYNPYKNLTGMYNQLKDVSFEARRGEILGIAGISGCGQKELLEAIAGLQPVENGSILYIEDDGTEVELLGKDPDLFLSIQVGKADSNGAVCFAVGDAEGGQRTADSL